MWARYQDFWQVSKRKRGWEYEMVKKKQIVVDSSGNEIPCVSFRKAAKILGMKGTELKLVMYKHRNLPYYRLMGKAKLRVIRIKVADLTEYGKSQDLFDGIADKIIQALKEMPVMKVGMTQRELAKDLKMTNEMINKIVRKKTRVGIKTLGKIAKALERDIDWFLE